MTTDETDERDEHDDADAALRAALTPDAVRSATRARLVARAAVDARARGLAGGVQGASAPRPSLARVIDKKPKWTQRTVPLPWAAALTLGLAAALAVISTLRQSEQSMRSTAQLVHSADTRLIDSLRKSGAASDSMLAALTGPQVHVVGLAAATARNPRALMFWDQATNRWTFIAHNLAPLAPGRTYQLWLVTDKAKISAGTFAVSASGDAVVQATYPLASNALKAVAVTEEPAGGVPQPTGSIVIVGTAGTQ